MQLKNEFANFNSNNYCKENRTYKNITNNITRHNHNSYEHKY